VRALIHARLRPYLVDVERPNPDGEIGPDRVETESSLCHLSYGFLFAPSLYGDAVHGAHRAGAVSAVAAMDKHGNAVGVRDYPQEFHRFFLVAIPGLHVDMHVSEAGALQSLPVGIEET